MQCNVPLTRVPSAIAKPLCCGLGLMQIDPLFTKICAKNDVYVRSFHIMAYSLIN